MVQWSPVCANIWKSVLNSAVYHAYANRLDPGTEGGSWIKETTNSVSPTKGSRPATGDQWLIDPNNVNRLVPIGAAGEIVLESYETTSGYLNDPVATSRAFLKSPAWADERNVAAGCKYLRLGDLGRYEDDGSITIYGRADTQIKVSGTILSCPCAWF
jgi:acyl-CoA synthetase (AMP-forming)/AMP-acid ligase II